MENIIGKKFLANGKWCDGKIVIGVDVVKNIKKIHTKYEFGNYAPDSIKRRKLRGEVNNDSLIVIVKDENEDITYELVDNKIYSIEDHISETIRKEALLSTITIGCLYKVSYMFGTTQKWGVGFAYSTQGLQDEKDLDCIYFGVSIQDGGVTNLQAKTVLSFTQINIQ